MFTSIFFDFFFDLDVGYGKRGDLYGGQGVTGWCSRFAGGLLRSATCSLPPYSHKINYHITQGHLQDTGIIYNSWRE